MRRNGVFTALRLIKFKAKPYTHKVLWRLMTSPLPLRDKPIIKKA